MACTRTARCAIALSCALLGSAAMVGCGNSGSEAAPGGDSGTAPAIDANEGARGGSDAGIGTDGASSPQTGASPDAGTLHGPMAFSVGSLRLGVPSIDCEGHGLDAGIVPAVGVIFAEQGQAAQYLCAAADAGLPEGGIQGDFLDLEIATGEWATYGSAPLTKSLIPGTYTIANEREDDEDLCMLPLGEGTAILQIYPAGGDAFVIAVSGTVTLASVSAEEVVGSFDVQLGPPFQADASTTELTGAFDAHPCP